MLYPATGAGLATQCKLAECATGWNSLLIPSPYPNLRTIRTTAAIPTSTANAYLRFNYYLFVEH